MAKCHEASSQAVLRGCHCTGHAGTSLAPSKCVETGHRRSIVEASERFATEARDAASTGDHLRAAALYWAAAMVLGGQSAGEIEFLLKQFTSFASALESGALREDNELSP